MRSEGLADSAHAARRGADAVREHAARERDAEEPEPPRPAERSEPDRWLAEGVVAGSVGAVLIAVFFLIVDLILGRPFWTPAALGSALFRGEVLAPGASPPAALVLAYSFVHGAVFVAIGVAAAVFRSAVRTRFAGGLALLLWGCLFACFEVVFLGFAALFMGHQVPIFDSGLVAAANLLAAGCMAALLAGPAPWRRWRRPRGR